MTKQITLRQLREMLRNPDIDEQELREYVELDEVNSRAFAPVLRPKPDLVDTEGLEADILLGTFNSWSRSRRQQKYRRKIAQGWSGLKIVSEGDSWFQYPIILDDVIDQLFDRYAIYSLGAAGDLLEYMLKEDELTQAIATEQPDVFLISGGGNDLVGNGRLATMVHAFEQTRLPQDYPNDKFNLFLTEINDLYRGLFSRLTSQFPTLKIVTHGYDRVIPNNGRWLGKPLSSKGIHNQELQKEILAVVIDRFNDSLRSVTDEFDGTVFYIDCRNAVTDQQWFDELHPNNRGFQAVADRFASVIDAVTPSGEIFRGISQPLCPGRQAKIKDAQDLDHDTFRRLVARRARIITDAKVDVIDEECRRALEDDISQFFEKINQGADFLPASFLQKGSQRAKAVCRISVPGGFGTGFLIASHDFIMTNNHVLPDSFTAQSSVAEFGFEDSGRELLRVPLNPDKLFITDEDLDFTIVGCDGSLLEDVEPIPLLRNPATITREERVNIIQHPRGRPKEIAIHENKVIRILDKVVRYRTDTEPGSSGSPVFNNQWDLVALHHAGWAEAGGTATNEGIRIASIVAHLLGERQRRGEVTHELDAVLNLVPDSSPLLGFFDIDGVEPEDTREIEVPSFAGTPDFADVGFWNIEHFNGQISQQRVERVADVLDRLSMDVMGLVEVEKPALEDLVEALRQRGNAVDFKLLDVPGRQDLAVLFDLETTTVELADDIEQRHRQALSVTTPSGRSAFPRKPLFARCRVVDNTEPIEFMMIVVHLKAFGDAQSKARRRLAAEVLNEIIEDVRNNENLPVVLGGDFNETLNNDVLDSLLSSPDLFTLTSDDAMNNAISFIGSRHRSLIDHIMVSRDVRLGSIAGDDAAIVRLDRGVRDFSDDVSDHVPIVMRMVGRSTPIDVPDVGGEEETSLPVPTGTTKVTLNFS